MFSNDCKENITGSASIEDIDAAIFSELLLYFYTGKVPAMEEIDKAIELLIIADKYQLDSLKFICETEMSEKMLTSETMFNLLITADNYNAPNLKEKTIEFISSRATSKDILKGLFDNKLNFGNQKALSLMKMIQELTK